MVVGGIFQINQCTQSPFGASGSSLIRTRETVSEGISVKLSSGEMSWPWQVCLVGILELFWKAGLEICIFVGISMCLVTL